MSWICPKCETENPDRLSVCEVCDSPRERSLTDKIKESLRAKYSAALYTPLIQNHHTLLASAEKGEADSQYKIGEWLRAYAHGYSSDKYNKTAILWYQKAAMRGHIDAQIKLARCYEEGYGVYKDIEAAIKWYKKAADKGDSIAKQRYLKLRYADKIYEAVIRYRMELLVAADNDNRNSQYLLGEWLSCHNDQSSYREEAFFWYEKAAKNGHVDAMLKLGECYENGTGVYSNYYEAIRWYKKAAKSGNDSAQLRLARAYLYGNMVAKNVEEALKWYDLVGRGLSGADLCNIGYAYDIGDSVQVNKVKAVEYYRKAAERGDEVAQYNMGVCYENGAGVVKDISLAKYWYEKSAGQGYEQARQRVSSIQFDIYTKEQEKKGCLTYIVTGIVALIGFVILINQPKESWAHNKLIFDYEIGNIVWICSLCLTYFISKNIFGYEE